MENQQVCDWCQREEQPRPWNRRPAFWLCPRHREEVLRKTEEMFAQAVNQEKEDD